MEIAFGRYVEIYIWRMLFRVFLVSLIAYLTYEISIRLKERKQSFNDKLLQPIGGIRNAFFCLLLLYEAPYRLEKNIEQEIYNEIQRRYFFW